MADLVWSNQTGDSSWQIWYGVIKQVTVHGCSAGSPTNKLPEVTFYCFSLLFNSQSSVIEIFVVIILRDGLVLEHRTTLKDQSLSIIESFLSLCTLSNRRVSSSYMYVYGWIGICWNVGMLTHL